MVAVVACGAARRRVQPNMPLFGTLGPVVDAGRAYLPRTKTSCPHHGRELQVGGTTGRDCWAVITGGRCPPPRPQNRGPPTNRPLVSWDAWAPQAVERVGAWADATGWAQLPSVWPCGVAVEPDTAGWRMASAGRTHLTTQARRGCWWWTRAAARHHVGNFWLAARRLRRLVTFSRRAGGNGGTFLVPMATTGWLVGIRRAIFRVVP